jgi:hypothetical protein
VLHHKEVVLDCPSTHESTLIVIHKLGKWLRQSYRHCFGDDLGEIVNQTYLPVLPNLNRSYVFWQEDDESVINLAKTLPSAESNQPTALITGL